MKKIIGLTSLLVLATGSAMAATTGNLLLKGTVPAVLSISVSPEAVASNLPLDTTQADTKVASVNEVSNSNTGYNVSISSQNLGKLVHSSVTSSSINYGLKYDSTSVDLSAADTFTFGTASSVDVIKDIEISYTGIPHANLIQGDYTDTVTFTISAN